MQVIRDVLKTRHINFTEARNKLDRHDDAEDLLKSRELPGLDTLDTTTEQPISP